MISSYLILILSSYSYLRLILWVGGLLDFTMRASAGGTMGYMLVYDLEEYYFNTA